MSEEWGPWIDHDGTGCPVPIGVMYNAEFEDGDAEIGVRGFGGFVVFDPSSYTGDDGSWLWEDDYFRIVRYRIRKPAALQTLINIAANPAPMPEEIDA